MSASAGVRGSGSAQTWQTSSGSSSPPKSTDWERHRKTIEDFYIVRDWSLENVQREMAQNYGFKATKRMFKSRLSSWGMGKNISKQDWQHVSLLLHEREKAGKKTSLLQIRKRSRTVKDYEKFVKDCETTEADFLAQAIVSGNTVVPHYIRCITPDSSTSEASRDGDPQQKADTDVAALALHKHHSNSSYSTSNPNSGKMSSFVQLRSHNAAMQLPSQPNGEPAVQHIEAAGDDFEELVSQSTASVSHYRTCDSLQQDLRIMVAQSICPERLQSFAPGVGDLHTWTYFSRSPGSGFPVEICSKCGKDISEHDSVPQDFLSGPVTEAPNKYQSLELGDELNHCSGFTAACMSACMYGVKGEYDLLSLCLLHAAGIFKQMLVQEDPLALLAVNTALIWLHAHEQGKMAESVIKFVLRAANSVLAADHGIILSLEWMTAAAGQKQKTCHIQTTTLRGVYEKFKVSHGFRHQHTIIALYNLGHNLIQDKAYEQAESSLQDLVEISTATLGAGSLQTVAAYNTLSRAQSLQGNFALARETLKRGLLYAPLGENHPFRLKSVQRHAFLLKKLGRHAEEEPLRFAVLRGRIATLGPQHADTQMAHDDLVDLLKALGTWEEKKKEVEEASEKPPPRSTREGVDEDKWRRIVVEGGRW